jgi:16S rRNA (adenine1518-N6/adenine1519-N6)-dimethyltransferase
MNYRPKKSLGQNFLTDVNIINKIIDSVIIEDKEILEIGPGTGNLTEYIIKKKPKKFYVVEKDNDLALSLKKKFNDSIDVINEDILKISEESISKNTLTVFGNLPYNISTEILSNWIVNLKNNFWFDKLILMFQKEVADRIIAKTNSSAYGRLSILSNWKLEVNKIIDIKPQSFFPKPKIDSSLLIFKPKNNFFKLKDSKNLEKITRIFFSQRRKMLKKPFNQVFKGKIEISNKLNIDLNLRPQNLTPEKYYELTKEYEDLTS